MADIDGVASRLIRAYDRAETLEPFTSADPNFDMALPFWSGRNGAR